MAKRSDLYPDGRLIAIVLPDTYELASNPGVPAGQMCSNCKAYNPETAQCGRWYNAYVRPGFWCSSFVTKG